MHSPAPEHRPRPAGPRPTPVGGPRRTGAPAPLPSGNRPLSAFDVLVVGMVCFVLAGLLNAQHLERMAADLPTSSSLRKPAMTVSGWVASISGVFQLTRPGEAIDDRRPGGAGFTEAGDDPLAGVADPTADDPAVDPAASTTVAGAAPTEDPAAGTTVAEADVPAPTLPPGPKVPTAADKAVVYIAGDSLAKDLAVPLQGLVQGTGVARAVTKTEVGTGLVRPDRFNWLAQFRADMSAQNPDIVVVEFGGNDAQGIPLQGGDIQSVLDPRWAVEYGKRVGAAMDLLNAGGRKLVWVGIPNSRDEAKNAEFAIIRQVTIDEANKRAGVAYVDTWALFVSPEGNYADYILIDDDLKEVRQSDGFHLNTNGVDYLAREVQKVIADELRARGAQLPG